MTPDKHSGDGGNSLSFLLACLVTSSKDLWDGISHKALLAIFTAIIGTLTYWGFSTTLDRLFRVENNQTTFMADNNRHYEELKTLIMNQTTSLHDADMKHERDLSIFQERQNNVIKCLEDIMKKNGEKK